MSCSSKEQAVGLFCFIITFLCYVTHPNLDLILISVTLLVIMSKVSDINLIGKIPEGLSIFFSLKTL